MPTYRTPCLPGTGNDHKPMQHLACVDAWIADQPVNTRTCLTDPDAALRGRPSHDRCGPWCPGPDSQGFRVAQRARHRAALKGGGDDRPLR